MAEHDTTVDTSTNPRDPLEPLHRRWEERGWGAVDKMHAYGSLLRTRRLVLAAVNDALAGIGLTGSRHTLLMTLDCAADQALTIGQLSRRTMSHPTSVTKLVDALLADGYVRKEVPEHDRRSIVVHLTPRGDELLAKAAAALVDIEFGLAGLDEDDVQALTRAFDRVRQDLHDMD